MSIRGTLYTNREGGRFWDQQGPARFLVPQKNLQNLRDIDRYGQKQTETDTNGHFSQGQPGLAYVSPVFLSLAKFGQFKPG